MTALKLIGDYPHIVDVTFLDLKDVPFFLFAILLLFYSYYKLKRKRNKSYSVELNPKTDNTSDFGNYDVLMQPKKVNSNKLPLINFSMPYVSFKQLILGITLIVFYYLIFTEKI